MTVMLCAGCFLKNEYYESRCDNGFRERLRGDGRCRRHARIVRRAFRKTGLSAHRTPELLYEYARTAKERGIGVIIAGAGGAAHLPGMVAAMTTLPVVGVPVKSLALNGLDSLLSIVQMPGGVPVATTAINGAKNAALIAVSILALSDEALAAKLESFRAHQTDEVLKIEL